MLKPIKMLVFLSVLSWSFISGNAIIAQSTSNLEDDMTFSGESLQGIDIESDDVNEDW